MKLKLPVHLRYHIGDIWKDDPPEERFFLDDYAANNEYTVHVRAIEVEVDAPDDFDYRPIAVRELERARDSGASNKER